MNIIEVFELVKETLIIIGTIQLWCILGLFIVGIFADEDELVNVVQSIVLMFFWPVYLVVKCIQGLHHLIRQL